MHTGTIIIATTLDLKKMQPWIPEAPVPETRVLSRRTFTGFTIHCHDSDNEIDIQYGRPFAYTLPFVSVKTAEKNTLIKRDRKANQSSPHTHMPFSS